MDVTATMELSSDGNLTEQPVINTDHDTLEMDTVDVSNHITQQSPDNVDLYEKEHASVNTHDVDSHEKFTDLGSTTSTDNDDQIMEVDTAGTDTTNVDDVDGGLPAPRVTSNEDGATEQNFHAEDDIDTSNITQPLSDDSTAVVEDDGAAQGSTDTISIPSNISLNLQPGKLKSLADLINVCRVEGFQIFNDKPNIPESEKMRQEELKRIGVSPTLEKCHMRDDIDPAHPRAKRRASKILRKHVNMKQLANVIIVCRTEGKQTYNDTVNVPETDKALVQELEEDDMNILNPKYHCAADSFSMMSRSRSTRSRRTIGTGRTRSDYGGDASYRTDTRLASRRTSLLSNSRMSSAVTSYDLPDDEIDSELWMQQRMRRRSRHRRPPTRKYSLADVIIQRNMDSDQKSSHSSFKTEAVGNIDALSDAHGTHAADGSRKTDDFAGDNHVLDQNGTDNDRDKSVTGPSMYQDNNTQRVSATIETVEEKHADDNQDDNIEPTPEHCVLGDEHTNLHVDTAHTANNGHLDGPGPEYKNNVEIIDGNCSLVLYNVKETSDTGQTNSLGNRTCENGVDPATQTSSNQSSGHSAVSGNVSQKASSQCYENGPLQETVLHNMETERNLCHEDMSRVADQTGGPGLLTDNQYKRRTHQDEIEVTDMQHNRAQATKHTESLGTCGDDIAVSGSDVDMSAHTSSNTEPIVLDTDGRVVREYSPAHSGKESMNVSTDSFIQQTHTEKDKDLNIPVSTDSGSINRVNNLNHVRNEVNTTNDANELTTGADDADRDQLHTPTDNILYKKSTYETSADRTMTATDHADCNGSMAGVVPVDITTNTTSHKNVGSKHESDDTDDDKETTKNPDKSLGNGFLVSADVNERNEHTRSKQDTKNSAVNVNKDRSNKSRESDVVEGFKISTRNVEKDNSHRDDASTSGDRSRNVSIASSYKSMSSEARMMLIMTRLKQRNDDEMELQTSYLDTLEYTRKAINDEYRQLCCREGKGVRANERTKKDEREPQLATIPDSVGTMTEPRDIKREAATTRVAVADHRDKAEEEGVPNTESDSSQQLPHMTDPNAEIVKQIKENASTRLDTKWNKDHPAYEQIKNGFKSEAKITTSNGVEKELARLKRQHFSTNNISESSEYLKEAKRIYPQGFVNPQDKSAKPVKQTSPYEKSKARRKDRSMSPRRNSPKKEVEPKPKPRHQSISPVRHSLKKQTETEPENKSNIPVLKPRNRTNLSDEPVQKPVSKPVNKPKTAPDNVKTANQRKHSPSPKRKPNNKVRFNEDHDNSKLQKDRAYIEEYQRTMVDAGETTEHSIPNVDKKRKIPRLQNDSVKKNKPLHQNGSVNLEFTSRTDEQYGTTDSRNGVRDANSVKVDKEEKQRSSGKSGKGGRVEQTGDSAGNSSTSSIQSSKDSISAAVEIVQSRSRFYGSGEEAKTNPREHRVMRLYKEIQLLRHVGDNYTSLQDEDGAFLLVNYDDQDDNLARHRSNLDMRRFLYDSVDYDLCSKTKNVNTGWQLTSGSNNKRRERALVALRHKIHTN